TRDVLLRLLANDSSRLVVQAALASARRLWGDGALEPDYALLQNRQVTTVDGREQALNRACQRGTPARLFRMLADTPEAVQESLAASLLTRATPPVAEAQAAVGSPDERTARVAAQVLGRAGKEAAAAGTAVLAALEKWRGVWEEKRVDMARKNVKDERLIKKITPGIQSLVWAAGRLEVK